MTLYFKSVGAILGASCLLLAQERKEKTMLLHAIEEMLMVNLSVPLA